MMNFEFINPYVEYLIFFLLGLIVLFIKTYISEKAKFKAVVNQNLELQKRIEEIKKDHQLDIAKRKYQYESKKDQYLNFFIVLDSFNKTVNEKFKEIFLPAYTDFFDNAIKGKEDQSEALSKFNTTIQNLMTEANKDLITIRHETNSIRLIASENIVEQLDHLALEYEVSFDLQSKYMKDTSNTSIHRNLEISGKKIMKIREDIINQMRLELNEI